MKPKPMAQKMPDNICIKLYAVNIYNAIPISIKTIPTS
jgi:hypothetical protein